MTFAVKNKENPIDPIKREKRNKRQISRQQKQIKGRQMTPQTRILTLRERERERVGWNSKPHITHIDFPLLHFEATKP